MKSFPVAQEALANAGIDPKLRPENLSPEEFLQLALTIYR